MANKKRISKVTKAVEVIHTPEGYCLNEKSFGKVHEMKKVTSVFGVDEYTYVGKLHQGEVTFIGGEGLKEVYPVKEGDNHGFTLEGKAQEIFHCENALVRHSDSENRDFVYVNPKSVLKFVGDTKKCYTIKVRFYDNCYGEGNNRWVVIYAE